jgi:hypothetical protein
MAMRHQSADRELKRGGESDLNTASGVGLGALFGGKLRVVVAHGGETGCLNGRCPTIYEKPGEDAYYVQGAVPNADILQQIDLPSGEQVVRIPKSLVDALKRL